MSAQNESSLVAVEIKDLTKAFGPVVANNKVSLKIAKGSIHGIIGENGAGKSTTMKMLYGLYHPDSGQIFVNGKEVNFHSPKDAISHGIGMVHQHFMLAEPMTVLDNILLGYEQVGAFFSIKRKAAQKKLEALCQQYGLHVDLMAKIEDLPVGLQQRVEILKLLYRDCDILILDEPTAVLTPQETLDFFAQLKKLKAQGKTIIIITHKLKEILNLTDEVTVFRAGLVVGHCLTAQTNSEELSSLMIGRQTVKARKDVVEEDFSNKACVLKVDSLSNEILKKVSFNLRKGEILGIAGVEGNGQSDLLKALLYPQFVDCAGEIEILGQKTSHLNTQKIKKMKIGVLPENRQRQGMVLDFSVRDNFLLGAQRSPEFQKNGILQFEQLTEACGKALVEYNVRPQSTTVRAGGLSGGNQQKLVVAREMRHQPDFIVAAHPTRGVDIGAIEFIHAELVKARNRGAGILLVSSELDEVLELSDRILVFYNGQIQLEILRKNFNEQKIGLAMAGGHA